ncbi:unnamed protein product [Adineta steineri]|uniref:Ion transport domain-containing protein n=1 Tax=Adineta steineri TaxID=433720 RepID=A0A815SFW5_9BILA|nr:unnamed protein product [Adineta steineri]CAF1641701.1 unnamed protein product [Adineta steineri]
MFLNFIDLKAHSHIEADFDLAILQALLNVTSNDDSFETNKEQKREQLNLAFEWKRIDIIKNFIMKDEKDWKKIELNDLFEKALVQNQTSFIQLFLDHDFPLNDLFEDYEKLVTLYKNENYDITEDFNNPLRAIYKEIIQPLLGDFFQIDAIFPTDDLPLNNQTKSAALIATLLYKSKARKEKDESFIEWADEFQNLAVEILEKFYSTNPYECTQAIIREIPQFGNVTWLHLAVMAEAKLFIAQKAIQDVLSDIWYGYINHRVGNKKIVLASLIPFYSGFLHYHKELVEGSEKCKKSDNFEDTSNFFQYRSSRSRSTSDSGSDPVCTKLMDDFSDEDESVIIANNNSWESIKCDMNQYIKNVLMFLHAPYVKYLYNVYSHMIFLMLFSYVILFDFFPIYDFISDKCLPSIEELRDNRISINNTQKRLFSNRTKQKIKVTAIPSVEYGFQWHHRPRTTELILIIWMFTLFCEEIRQIIAMEVQSVYGKLVAYFSIIWNKLDVLAISLFFIAFVLRLLPINQCFCGARVLLALDLSIWYIRTLDMFSAIKRLGPKLVMIGEMVNDMKFYMIMLTVFILAFGVPSYSLMYGVQEFSFHTPRAIINLAYWQIFGEIEILGDIEKNYEINGYIVFILLIAYMTVASVLLINLLIAMFSNTFDRLHMDTDCIWKFQHYSLVSYYLTRPTLPPPLVAFSHIYRITIYFFSHICKIKWFQTKYLQHTNRAKFKISADEVLTKQIEGIEDALGNEVYFFSLKTERKQLDRQNDLYEQRVHSPQEIVLNKIKILENQVLTIQNQQVNMFEYMEYLMNGIKKIGGDDIEMPKRSSPSAELISSSSWTLKASDATIGDDDHQCHFQRNRVISDLNACLTSCDQLSGCNVANYNAAQKMCNLNRCNTLSPSISNGYKGYQSWMKNPTASSSWTLFASDKTIADSKCPSISFTLPANLDACLTSCDQIAECNAAVYNNNANTCTLRKCSTLSPTTIKDNSAGFNTWIKKSTDPTYTSKAFLYILNHGGYAILSAGRNPYDPYDFYLNDSAINYRREQLHNDLIEHSYLFSTIRGVYDGIEEISFLVSLFNSSLEQIYEIVKFGIKYNQESVIYVGQERHQSLVEQQLIYINGKFNGTYISGNGYKIFSSSSSTIDNYSEIDVCPNNKFSFTLKFDFSYLYKDNRQRLVKTNKKEPVKQANYMQQWQKLFFFA